MVEIIGTKIKLGIVEHPSVDPLVHLCIAIAGCLSKRIRSLCYDGVVIDFYTLVSEEESIGVVNDLTTECYILTLLNTNKIYNIKGGQGELIKQL